MEEMNCFGDVLQFFYIKKKVFSLYVLISKNNLTKKVGQIHFVT